MGFNKVYKSLQEIFPQIDARVLRAVAIEHSKDVDAAVETVLAEIIPFFTERSGPKIPSTGESSEGAIVTTQTALGSADGENGYTMNVGNQQSFHDPNEGRTEPFNDRYNGYDEGEGNITELTLPGYILGDNVQMKIDLYSHIEDEGEGNSAELALSENILENRMQINIDVYSHGEADQLINGDSVNAHQIVSGEPKKSETISDDKYPETSTNIASDDIPSHSLGISQDDDNGTSQNLILFQETVDNSHLETEFGLATKKEGDQGKSYEDDNHSVVGPASLTIQDPTACPIESDYQLALLQNMFGGCYVELDLSLPDSDSTASKMETARNIVGTEDESNFNASLSQSSQINIIDALEEIIADARNNKKTLFSSMQSVISLMREVELKEQAAEQAKVEAAVGGSDTLVKSEELQQMVQQAEEANAMHAGEVYGEKAILATELRELQSRALSLSDERDKSLAVLDEMQQTLEMRLAEAQSEIKSADQEKKEKEKAAMKALSDQELIMERVVQESKILKQQALDNAKLREFLVDRGRVVDTLQGEIAVICQDVRLLKENFDEHVPFSKSLSSSQTSCILASSSSSSKSLIPEQVDGGLDSIETQKERGMRSSVQSSEEVDVARDVDGKAPSDDGWELFDHHEIHS